MHKNISGGGVGWGGGYGQTRQGEYSTCTK